MRQLGAAALALLIAAGVAGGQQGTADQIARIEKLLAEKPNHTGAVWYGAFLLANAGNREEAIRWLERLVRMGVGFEPSADSRFHKKLVGAPGYDALVAEARRGLKRVAASRPAFRIAERDLLPEGIAHDPTTGTFYVGSLYKAKIVAVDRAGRARDFVAAGRDGLVDVLGMKVDAKRRTLWAASARAGASALYAFDLATGALKGRYPVAGEGHQLNDLVVDAGGGVYATDTTAGAVYRLAPGAAALEPFLAPGQLIAPNGIAISDDGRDLFVANFHGVRRVRVADRSTTDLAFPGPIPTGIDGLSFHEGHLVAIENVTSPGRVVRYELDRARERVLRTRVLEAGHPELAIPTTGVVARGRLYFIANSHVDQLGENNTISDPSVLRDPLVLSLPL
jgi:sugar lactone lactonase YvrE